MNYGGFLREEYVSHVCCKLDGVVDAKDQTGVVEQAQECSDEDEAEKMRSKFRA